MEKLNIPVRYIKGVGPKRAKMFKRLGIDTIEDLLYYFPRRYEDRTHIVPVSELKEGLRQTVKVKVLSLKERRSFRRRHFSLTQALVGDDSGAFLCVWFNQPYVKEYLKKENSLILYGKVELYGGHLQMSSPEFEVSDAQSDESLSAGKLVPVYSLPDEITQRTFRQFIKGSLDEYLPKIQDFLTYDIRAKHNLMNLAKALLNIHFPESAHMQMEAYTRIAFEEFFLFQIPIVLRKFNKKQRPGIPHKLDGELPSRFINSLPFKLTSAQEKVIAEISEDMSSPLIMQRLLQGDVGSGKTVVATVAALIAIQGGYQTAFMVPTEILARQHYDKISCQLFRLLRQAGLPVRQAGVVSRKIKIGLLTSGLDKKEKTKIYKKIKEGKVDLVIGTHALIEEDIQFLSLGLVIIDEQHKFGVAQRALLPQKGVNPDVLIMTATPIPRTLAITLYGDLDISVIDELPAGRQPVKTLYFPQADQVKAYDIAKEQLRLGHQVYIIYPVIEESYALDIAGAKRMYEELKELDFKNYRLGLIHGKLKKEEQDSVMSRFKNKKINVLISTSVLEVGIDVANATCMIIQNAERFGLSQLHQLRGRVGRSEAASFCLLVSDPKTEEAKARFKAMVEHNDGFRIAEEDLKIRGPGEFFGDRQHGLSELKIGNPLSQMRLLRQARQEAIRIIGEDPGFGKREHILLKEKLFERFPEYEKLNING